MQPPLRKWAIPLGLGLAALALRLVLFTGLQCNDDRLYAVEAWDLLQGRPNIHTQLFATRVGFTAPVAFLYAIFGARTWCLYVPALAASLSLVALAWKLGRDLYSERGGIAAAAFVALLPLDIVYGTAGFADVPLAALIGGGAYLVWRAPRSPSWLWRAAVGGLLWGLAHLVKESAVLLLLPAALLVGGREHRRALGVAAATLAGVIAAEACVYGLATGDPLFRLHLAQSVQSGPRVDSSLWTRLGAIPSFMGNPRDAGFPYGGGLHAVALAGLILGLRKKLPAVPALGVWWLGSGLLLELFPSRLFPFHPMLDVQPRMLAIMTLPGAVLAGAGALALKEVRWIRWAAAGGAAFALACAVRIHADAVRWRWGVEWGHEALQARPGTTVVTDPRTALGLRMLSAFSPPWELRVYSRDLPPPSAGTLLLMNGRLAGESRRDGAEPPPWWETGDPPRASVAERRWPGAWRLRGPSGPEERAAILEALPRP